MKRITAGLLIGVMCMGIFAGCASSAKNVPVNTEEKETTQEAWDETLEEETEDETVQDEPSEEEMAQEEEVTREEAVVKEKKNDLAVVTTSTAICEILDILDYDNVVGIPETTGSIPARYEGITTVGAPMSPDMEIIKSISPDLVLSPKTLEDSLSEQYRAAGIETTFLDLSSVQGMYESIDSLGEVLERQDEAAAIRAEYESYMAEYTVEEPENNSCMILMCFPSGYYLIATENSYVGNLVELAGGANVYSDYQGDENGFVAINPEDMIQKNPDKIFVYAHYSEEEAFGKMEEIFATDTTWQFYDAVKNGEIYYLSSELFGMSATLSWMDSLEYLKPILYGE